MRFDRVMELARATPTAALCEAWGANAEAVEDRKNGERPMSLREAGALAEMNVLRLEDILTR